MIIKICFVSSGKQFFEMLRCGVLSALPYKQMSKNRDAQHVEFTGPVISCHTKTFRMPSLPYNVFTHKHSNVSSSLRVSQIVRKETLYSLIDKCLQYVAVSNTFFTADVVW